MLTNEEQRALVRQARRVHRLKIKLTTYAVGASLVTGLWVLHEWLANGAFERFAHEGNRGDWNPTLWAVAVGAWTLAVGVAALRVHLERPPTAAEVEREAERLRRGAAVDDVRRLARWRIEQLRRLRFHAAAWALGMILIAPLNVLIEWQDNGAFHRLSSDSRPGSWDPWVLYVGGIWAAVVALGALWAYLNRPGKGARPGSGARRLRPSG